MPSLLGVVGGRDDGGEGLQPVVKVDVSAALAVQLVREGHVGEGRRDTLGGWEDAATALDGYENVLLKFFSTRNS